MQKFNAQIARGQLATTASVAIHSEAVNAIWPLDSRSRHGQSALGRGEAKMKAKERRMFAASIEVSPRLAISLDEAVQFLGLLFPASSLVDRRAAVVDLCSTGDCTFMALPADDSLPDRMVLVRNSDRAPLSRSDYGVALRRVRMKRWRPLWLMQK